MEEMFVRAVKGVAMAVEAAAALMLTWGAARAFAALVKGAATGRLTPELQKQVWMRLARWLVLSLEFQLAADLLHTTISRTWTDIGHVAALAAIRTFLAYALDADLEKISHPEPPAPRGEPASPERPAAGQ
jgi:uncharacterized membrane protein